MSVEVKGLLWRKMPHALPGELLFFGSTWWLSVISTRNGQEMAAALALTGAGTGKLLPMTQDPVFTFEGEGWIPTVSEIDAVVFEGPMFGALSISSDGPLVWGSFGTGGERCFLLDGTDVSETDLSDFNAAPRFPHWVASLIDSDGSKSKLFDVIAVEEVVSEKLK